MNEGAAHRAAPDDPDGTSQRRARRAMIAVVAVLAVLAVVAAALAIVYVRAEREREVRNWQVRLSIVADGRAGALSQWLDEQFAVLTGLAGNPNVQLYALEMSRGGGRDTAVVEGTFLRTLLNATADQAGFAPLRRSARVDANVGASSMAGLAVLNTNGTLIVGSDFLPRLPEGLGPLLARAADGRSALHGPVAGASGGPVLGFAVPLYGVQQDPDAGAGIGYVVGVRPFDRTVFAMLEQPGNPWQSAETYLVRRDGESVRYLTPLEDGAAAMSVALTTDTPRLAAARALGAPGEFGFGRNHAGDDVLFTSRAIAGTDWVLVHTVSESEALGAAEARLRTILIAVMLVIVGLLVGTFALWRHGTSLRLAQAAERHRQAAERLRETMAFVRVVTDGQPTAIAAVDEGGRYSFANAGAAWGSGLTPDQIVGKTMTEVMGPHVARRLQEMNARALLTGARVTEVSPLQQDGTERTIKSDHIPLAASRDHPRSVLMVLEDVSALMQERQRREDMLRDLVGTLVGLVDRRDPFSSDHSRLVAELSVAIAQEMGEPEETCQTVDFCGKLMNLGKILVPEEVLTRSGPITEDEKNTVRAAVVQTADLLSGVSFDLPVGETLRQIQERWDGRGYPDGLKGEEILVSARIVMVANAFVGMVSPRAFRGAMPIEAATRELMAGVGVRYDNRAVVALMNYLENRGGAARWSRLVQESSAANGANGANAVG